MDSLITAAAHALARGDVLGALNRVALRSDPPALALRGIALAQLGDFLRAKRLLRQAARAFGPKDVVARARCVLAEAEIALASRDLVWPGQALRAAAVLLRTRGDHRNALYARHLEVRRLLMLGRLDAAEAELQRLSRVPLPAALQATHALLSAGIALRRLRISEAQRAFERAEVKAREARIPSLLAEIQTQARVLEAPAARLGRPGEERPIRLSEVEALHRSPALLIDGTRRVVRRGSRIAELGRRPILWQIVTMLAHAWPGDVQRSSLISSVFRMRRIDDSHRARLRVEVGRLRGELQGLAQVDATAGGYALRPRGSGSVQILSLAIDEPHAAAVALLADGESWSSSALALALGLSQRSVQRIVEALETDGRARSFGRGRAQRWVGAQSPGIATTLLLPAPLPGT